MSRILSELLGTNESDLRLNLMQLERAAGAPNADIRLTSQILAGAQAKIRQLGLDPHDTTGPELYRALQQRFLDDEQRVRTVLGLTGDSLPPDILQHCKTFLESLEIPTEAFVLKPAVMRALIRKLQPKATLKHLGYRSLDSMLKHEPPAQLFAAVNLIESAEWRHKLFRSYKKLRPGDFEVRPVSFYLPSAKQWPALSRDFVGRIRHNLLCIRELGAVVILPLEQDLPGLAITTLLLGLQAVNDIRSQSSFLKLKQVKPDFGDIVEQAVTHEPLTDIELAGQRLPWQAIQRFYGRSGQVVPPTVFEPHVQADDLTWHQAEAVLARLHPALEFWQDGQLLGLLDHGQPVSFNILDVALAACNRLPYADRVVHFMRDNLWQELLGKYLHQENLENLVLGKLNQTLAPEPAYDEMDGLE